MEYYTDRPPRHAHRTPSELAEDEIFAALRGDVCVQTRIEASALTRAPTQPILGGRSILRSSSPL